jgi:iron complex outermembrane receptor protein
MKVMTVTAAVWAAIGGLSLATAANAAVTHFNLHIPREPLDAALRDLAHQTGVQVGHFSDQAQSGLLVGPVQGSLSPADALGMLLHSTGLSYRALSDRAYIVATPSALASAQVSAQSGTGGVGKGAGATHPSSNDSSVAAGKEGKRSSSGGFRVAQVARGQIAGDGAVASRRGDQPTLAQLEEVVVTAEKKQERLQDVPVPVSVINTQQLSSTDQVRLQDYYAQVPGLNLSPSEYGAPQLAIRGLTTGGFTNPTVGITIDDIPYGSPSALAEGNQAPDLDPSDLSRIEVLRGPQGTLYGASSLGGLIKYVTTDPSTSKLFGTLEAGLSGGKNGAEAGYSTRGSLNVPINDTLAIRASAFSRLDPGYIDNVVSGRKGVNRTSAEGGLFSALWRPNDVFYLKLMALVQYSNAEGASYTTIGLGDLKQSAVPGSGGSTRDSQIYGATMKFNFGAVQLTSVTGYNINKFTQSLDYTWGLGPYTKTVFGVQGSVYVTHVHTGDFTQELRLTGKISDSIDWLVGGFFEHSSTQLAEPLYAENELTGAIVGTWTTINTPNSYAEYAGFADVTYHVTQRFDIQFGARESHNRQSLSESFVGEPYAKFFFNASSPIAYPEVTSTGNSFTYLVTPRLKITPDLMVYARVTSGYRPGGPNYNASAGAPPQYAADTTKNYEVGVKGDFLHHVLTVDGSVYYIDWSDIQLQLNNPKNGLDYYANGSKAKSEGVELALRVAPAAGLSLGISAAYDDAVLTKPLPVTSTVEGPSGARLPYGSRVSGNATVDEEFPLYLDWSGFVGAAVSYVGEREGEFTATPSRQIFPAYATTNLRFGVRDDLWDITVYGNNVADRRGAVGGGVGSFIPYGLFYIQPRTFGVVVWRSFE